MIYMSQATIAAGTEPVNDWDSHETPSLLTFTNRVGTEPKKLTNEELSELLTRKFREIFP